MLIYKIIAANVHFVCVLKQSTMHATKLKFVAVQRNH